MVAKNTENQKEKKLDYCFRTNDSIKKPLCEIRNTSDERPILIMQNKANFQKVRMNLNFYSKKEYENGPVSTGQKNKANQSQFLCQKNLLIVHSWLITTQN